MTAKQSISDDPAAPFGREDDGTPLAPYGLREDGVPRKTASAGRRRGPGGAPRGPARKRQPSTSSAASSSGRPAPTDAQLKDSLVSLSSMFLVNGLVAGALAPGTKKLIGEKHAYALAGDAVIVNHFAPSFADGLIELSHSKPGILAWMDTITEKAPYLLLLKTTMELGKALMQNHANPSERLTNAGVTLGMINAQRMAEAVEREAAEMNIPVFTMPQEQAA